MGVRAADSIRKSLQCVLVGRSLSARHNCVGFRLPMTPRRSHTLARTFCMRGTAMEGIWTQALTMEDSAPVQNLASQEGRETFQEEREEVTQAMTQWQVSKAMTMTRTLPL